MPPTSVTATGRIPVTQVATPQPVVDFPRAAGTVVGIDPATGNLQVTSEPRVLRNDIERMSMVMAGAIARYKLARARAEITFQGYWPKAGLLGQILDVIEEANDTEYIDAPVTSVELIGGAEPMTIIRAGFAR